MMPYDLPPKNWSKYYVRIREENLEEKAGQWPEKGTPRNKSSENSTEAKALIAEGMTAVEAARKIGVRTLYIGPGSPWESCYIESFNGKLRDEVLSREVFDTLLGARKWLWSVGGENIIISTAHLTPTLRGLL